MKSKALHTTSRSAVPAITAALAAAGLIGSAQAAIQTAGALLVNVDATALPVGPLTSVPNAGTAGGFFEARGGVSATPRIEPVYVGGTKGIKLDGSDYLMHVAALGGAPLSAPAGLTGPNATSSVEAWVLNPWLDREETVVAWGHRGGPDGRNESLLYGFDARWGAIGHWGAPDIGWDPNFNDEWYPPGNPAPGVWHHLVYTYDGTTTRVYADGVLKNSEIIGIDTFPAPAITIGAQLTDDASTVEPALRGSMTIAKLRIHDEALTDAQVLNNFNAEAGGFSAGAGTPPAFGPIHRYSFSEAAGGAPDDSAVIDSVAGANGTVQGDGATFTGTRVSLPGGGSGSAAYVDLPNGMLSLSSKANGGSGQFTIEGWTKVTGLQTWARVFDIGSSADVEVIGPGGGGEGRDYLTLSAVINTEPRYHQLELRNVQPPTGDGFAKVVGNPTMTGREFHWVVTWDETTGRIVHYEDGGEASVTDINPANNPMANINDVNVWLGRSNWNGDANGQEEFDEVRIYDRVLSAEEVKANNVAGPGTVSPPQPITIVGQPQSVTVEELQSATFRVAVQGVRPYTWQWHSNNVPIVGATSHTLTLTGLRPSANGAQIKCVVGNTVAGTPRTATSGNAILTVNADTTAPTLVGAAGGVAWGLDDTHFGVRFSEPINAADATTLANYAVSGVTLVPGPLTLMPDNVTVVGFTTAGSLKALGCKTIRVTGVIRDRSPSQNPVAVGTAGATAGIVYAEGTMRWQRFNSSGAGFPNTADVISYVDRLENPEGAGNHGDNYRGQGLALISPPVTGQYTFYIASDDNSELFLSTDENPANKVVIAREPQWAEFRVWTGTIRSDNSDTGRGNPQANISTPITLNAGCRYYLEFVYNEGGGGDYMSVTWRTPGSPVPANGSAPIGAQYISPFEQAPNIPSGQPADQTLLVGRRATLTANITGSPNLVIQWFRDGNPIMGANGTSFTTDVLTAADNNAMFRVEAANSLGTAVSRTAKLTVNTDDQAPILLKSLPGPALDRFSLVFNEVMDLNAAIDNFNFTVNGNNPDSSSLSADGKVITLVTAPTLIQTPNTDYVIVIKAQADFAGNGFPETTVTVRSVIEACGGAQFQAYPAGGGNAVSILTSHPTFPDSPDFTTFIPNLDTRIAVDPANLTFYTGDGREAYGGRLRGLFMPTESGRHFFYFAADDNAELWLSTDASPANRVRIATETSWSNSKEWTTSGGSSSLPAKKSPGIDLIAGQGYYIEALYKEGGGGDHCAVAVQPPSATDPPANGSGAIGSLQLGQFAPANIIGPVTLAPAIPADKSVIGGSLVSFDVGATAPAPYAKLCYQWQRDSGSGFESIAGANSATYGFGPVAVADNGSKFRCVVSSIGSIVTSRAALLTVLVDTNPPVCRSIRVLPDLTHMDIQFSEFVEPMVAQDTFNYTVDGENPDSVALRPDGMSVRLALKTPVTPASQVCISIQNVADLAGNVINPNPSTKCIDTPTFSCGLLRFEAWNNIGGTAIDGLLNDPRYPDSPDETRIFGSFDTVTELGTINYRDNYGARVVGLFIPPTSGNWVFYLASDDASRLYLNPNGIDASGKQMIAEETGCCQNINAIRSAPIALTAGSRYYIEGVYKEGGGNDHIYVAARLEGQPAPNCVAFAQCADALRGELVGIYADGNGVSLDITTHPQDQTLCRDPNSATPPTATFTVQASAFQGSAPSLLASQDFNASNGGCTVENIGAPFEGPWTYDSASGSWKSDGQGPELSRPSSTRLTCPAVTVTRDGVVSLSFAHRYSFESGMWDGGQVRISKNGGAFTAVPPSAFIANGYNGTLLPNTAAELVGQPGFVETSAGHQAGTLITSTADLGQFAAGDTVRIQFLAANDTNTRNLRPQWEISSLSLTEGAGGAALPVVIQWQRNNGSGFVDIPFARSSSYSFVPTLADNGARFRALVAAPGAPCQTTYEATLTYVQINTAPRFTPGPNQSLACNAGPQSVPGWATGISAHSIVRVPTVYANDFNAGANGMTLAGTPIATISGGNLKLTTPVNSAYGAASIAAPVQTYESLNVTWKSYLGDGAGGGADGYTFNLGEDVVADPGYGGEEGTGMGLIVAVDTFDNGVALDPCTTGIELKWRGAVLTCTNVPKDNLGDGRFLRKSQFVNASVSVDATGLATFTYDGNTIKAQIPAYAGVRASRALFWARTGGANDNQWIDDFALQAFPFDSSSAEASQTVSFQVSNDKPGLFSVQPAVSPAGTLTYTPAPGACGTARVTVTAKDSGGTHPQCGGSDTSASSTFDIVVATCPPTIACPPDVNARCTGTNTPVSYTVTAMSCSGTPLPVTCVPASGSGFPEGTTPVTCRASDGGTTVTCTFRVIVTCNTCPVAVAQASPNAELYPNQTSTIVLSVNNSNACVVLDGSHSTDAEGDTLTYVWMADLDGNGTKEPIASGAVVTYCFELGAHEVSLIVDDGRCANTATLTVEVLSACEAVEVLITEIDNADLGRRNKRPLIASLKAACASFDRGSCVSGVNQLEAFQNKVRAQISRENPSVADDLIALAQEILDAIECEEGDGQ